MAYIGNDVRSNEDYKIIDDISSGFNGSTTSFALQVGGATPVPFPKFEQQLLISVNGVIQEPDPTGSAGFKLLGTNIVFSSAPTNGHAFFGVIYAGADYVNAGGTFPDGSINFPSITFSEDTNTGFTRTASGTISVISDGTKVAQFPTSQGSNGQVLVTDGGGTLSYSSTITSPIVSGDLTIPDKIVHTGDTNTAIRFPAADTFSVETAGTEKLRIDSGGHISIGTATSRAIGGSVERKLQVEATSADAGVAITRNSANAVGPFLSFGKSRSSSVGGTTVVQSGDQLGQINFSGADGSDIVSNAASIRALVDGTPGSNDMPGRLEFSTTADGAASVTERMRIDSSGRVGIGTTSPSRILHSSAGSDDNCILATSGAGNAYIGFADANTTNQTGLSVRLGSVGDSLIFQTGGTNERMRIASDGKVGIGTTAPASPLHIQKSGTSQNLLVLESDLGTNNNRTLIIGSPTSDSGSEPFRFTTGNSLQFIIDAINALTIDSSGKVGIGTTSPGHLLEIKSSAQNANDVLTQIESVAVSSGESKTSLELHKGTGYGAQLSGYISQGVGSGFILSTLNGGTATERMRIDSSGKVGIGTTSPATLLQIESTDPTFRVKRSDGSAYGELTSDTSGLISFKSDPGNAANGSGFIFTVDNSEKARIDSSGRVGIGTSSPSDLLHINTTGTSNVGILLKSTSSTYPSIIGDANRSGASLFLAAFQGKWNGNRVAEVTLESGPDTTNKDDGIVVIRTRGDGDSSPQDRMLIDSSGKVGIGTTSPSEELTISSSTPAVKLEDTDQANSYIQLSAANGDMFLSANGASSQGQFILRSGNNGSFAERMRIDSSGRFMVGVTSSVVPFQVVAGASGFGGENTIGVFSDTTFPTTGVGGGVTFSGRYNSGSSQVGYAAIRGRKANATDGNYDGVLTFAVRPNGANMTERMRINQNGVLLLNATTESTDPNQPHYLQVGQGSNYFLVEHNESQDVARVRLKVDTTSPRSQINLNNPNGTVGSIITDGSSTSYNTSSDYRLKENAVAISDGITRLKTLKPYRFNFIEEPSKTVDGFFAHEVTAVPEAVSGTKDEVDKNGDPVHQGLDYGRITPLLTAALQEAVAKIEVLETEVAALKAA